MVAQTRHIRNTEKIGDYVNISVPGFQNKGGETTETVSVHYFIEGEGEPVLLVHAPGQSLYTWRSLIPLLSKDYCVIALDLVGAGFSGHPNALSYSMDEVASCIIKFCEAISLNTTHICGFSLGAGYVLKAVIMDPERFSKTVLISPGGITKTMPRFMRLLEKSRLAFLLRELYGKSTVKNALSTCYYDATTCTEEIVREYYKTAEDFRARQAFQYSLRNFDLDGMLSDVFRLQRELLVLRGDEDRWHTEDDIEQLKRYFQHGVYYTQKNAGHLMHEERAEAVADIILKYLCFTGES